MITPRQEQALLKIPRILRHIVKGALTLPDTRPEMAIRAKCLVCKNGNVNDICQCADELCPLRFNRPYSKEKNNE